MNRPFGPFRPARQSAQPRQPWEAGRDSGREAERPPVRGQAPMGTVLASDERPGVVRDAGGTAPAVWLTGPGCWRITQAATGLQLEATGTDGASVVSLTASGGDGRFELAGIAIDGSVRALSADAVDLAGTLTIRGGAGGVLFGDVRDTTAAVSGAVGPFTVRSWCSRG